jgi:hypothetical protein
MSTFKKILDNLTFFKNEECSTYNSIVIGVVVDTDDPLQMGRLRIYCPDLNDDPKKVQHLPWAVYASPFGGSIRNSCYTRGHDQKNATSSGTTQYGFWAIPEKGANVLITCIAGDPRRRVWLGCLYEHGETSGLLNGVYDWESLEGAPDGPFCSPGPDHEDERIPLNPLYNNLSEAFKNEKDSAEWKTRGADYSGMVNTNIDSFGTNKSLQDNEDDEWVKEKLGAMGYDWSSFKNLGAYLSSKIFGWLTPGLHSITFDDRPFNTRIRIRTTAGHQILLDDTNERIYISPFKGNAWLELDVSGNIDIFSGRRISMHATKDINFSTDETFRVKAKKGIFMYAGDTRGQSPLDSIPADGQIRIQSSNDMHIYSEGNLYQKINENMHLKIDGNLFETISSNMHFTVNENLYENIIGDMNSKIGGDIFNEVLGDYNISVIGDLLIDANYFGVDANNIDLFAGSSILSLSSSSAYLQAANTVIGGNGLTQIKTGASIIELTPLLIALQSTAIITNIAIVEETFIIPPLSTSVPSLSISLPELPEISEDAKLTPWTNRVPEHESWPRVLKQDSDDDINKKNDGYKNNIDWIDQFDNETSPEGREDIGIIEGKEKIERGQFWRR